MHMIGGAWEMMRTLPRLLYIKRTHTHVRYTHGMYAREHACESAVIDGPSESITHCIETSAGIFDRNACVCVWLVCNRAIYAQTVF